MVTVFRYSPDTEVDVLQNVGLPTIVGLPEAVATLTEAPAMSATEKFVFSTVNVPVSRSLQGLAAVMFVPDNVRLGSEAPQELLSRVNVRLVGLPDKPVIVVSAAL